MSDETFGDRLKALRKAKGLRREDVAERLGMSTSSVQHHENDVREPNIETLRAYAKLYKRSLDWLLTGRESPKGEIVDLFESVDEAQQKQILAIARTFQKKA